MLVFLIKKTWQRFVATALSSIIFGIISVSLVALINEIINANGERQTEYFMVFAALALAGVVVQLISKLVAEQLSEHSQAELRKLVADKTIEAKISNIEAQGDAKIKSCLTEHSLKVAGFFMSMPGILTNAMIVLGAFVYMAWLDWVIFLFALLTLVLGSVSYSFANNIAFKKIANAAAMQDGLFHQFDAITDGIKELKLNRSKRTFFKQEVLHPAIDALRKERIEGVSILHMASSWGGFLIFTFIGGALFFLSQQTGEESQRIMSGFALLFLYMLTPLETLLANIPRAFAAQASANTIKTLSDELVNEDESRVPALASFERIQLQSLCHRYYHEQSDDIFSLQPIDIGFKKGELIYLVGGNGSGKTTFAKVLCGLYEADEGQIKVDNQAITCTDLDGYRQLFSTVFGDYYLFDRLLNVPCEQLEQKGNALIRKLNLHHKVSIEAGRFTTQRLSQGQRKRLALVVAYLEDRPFYLFDEWAADQDPVFKDVFYRELLPELRDKGKTVLVITHDDKYFALADRLLKMENGCLTEVTQSPVTPIPTLA
ncbi:cyclic peptide export ABC transporter [Pseudoalteromonas sp. SCSIO 43201]|uniref:Putative ATP-binding cassette transporter n=1 Tax=Pseudoalteromonas peptidolytica F12-50-A1 TaxID=1315280 RepID=A0A8I0MY87_9GAMM|nr:MULTISPECIES: cyclic peptide export ABC transporter [Pseudoalteromonas]MBE0348051.1 putative ATP-binding cassette transporter [Pseudoalteromonas peptidolytica F12-50-A1]NLR15653.1 cyclic peptide export ABC transporter [Pseudoalteromonas peptidolytica]USD28673.1 cyclic peptide export ABC transporter [Pseudoalteromonas sp. SCSIO 43201]GEK10961.1 peptide ABC transporter ATP-binding protein [Pseudoalteromonas peptidolytica]